MENTCNNIIKVLRKNRVDFEPINVINNEINIEVGVYGEAYQVSIEVEDEDARRLDIVFNEFEAMNTITDIIEVLKTVDDYSVQYGVGYSKDMIITMEVY